ncbi:MAG: alkaline phosphatase D family protein [Verrucomicrobiaceae bacterium]|nr:alkaline phosphatase D family protein [Verrucomicrobiaceae bacterium]
MTEPTTTRRQFIADTATVAASSLLAGTRSSLAQAAAPEFQTHTANDLDRIWLGAELWANPMQDWRIKSGRIECVNAALGRNVHVLTRELADREGDLKMSVRLGRVDGSAFVGGKGSAGFRIGILGTLGAHPELRDVRNNLAFSGGFDAGITATGAIFFGDVKKAEAGKIDFKDAREIDLDLTAQPQGRNYTLTLRAKDAKTGALLGEAKREGFPAVQLNGNLALVANFGAPQAGGGKKGKAKGAAEPAGPGVGTFWFSDWRIAGSKVVARDEMAYGPILFSQYTLSGGVVKLTAQMPPMGDKDSQTLKLELQRGGDWKEVAEEKIHPQARTATFRLEQWDAAQDVPYRLVYALRFADGTEQPWKWSGLIRRDPVDQPQFSVADISCNIHTAFPNTRYVENVAQLNPDMLAFVGDQFYENCGGFGTQRKPLDAAIIDYLRKWYFHGWTWRHLTKDRPSLSLPDDHDVYQGNIWGEGGAAQSTTQEAGGYEMPADWVNVVHRTQASHHPDPYDREPCKQGIINYYGPMTYGGVSFAILADRQFKSAPEGRVPPTGDRGDHVVDLNFDPKTADIAGLDLLGAKQVQFIKEWARDWKGAVMKAVISQTPFTGMATTHGGEREVLRADYDQNGWPQSARNAALREIRKCFAIHIAGDQHLPAVVHYGIDEHRDAGVAFAGPAVNVGYPRWWEPTEKVNGRKPGQGITGDFTDHFGHPMTVLAVKNGPARPSNEVIQNLIEKTSGFGLVRFDKTKRTITIECWPFASDFGKPGAPQFETWPVVTTQIDQYARKTAAQLPKLEITGVKNALVEVIDEKGELVHALRVESREWQPLVFAEGKYSVRVSDPESGKSETLKDVMATTQNTQTLTVTVG